jgi:hypothetical protein
MAMPTPSSTMPPRTSPPFANLGTEQTAKFQPGEGRREVGQAQGHRDQQEREHRAQYDELTKTN